MECLENLTEVTILALVMNGDSFLTVQEHLNPL
jgi:hypothetical protein